LSKFEFTIAGKNETDLQFFAICALAEVYAPLDT
jgi:hypothetical protein